MTRNIWGRCALGAFTVGAVAVSAFGFVPAAAAATAPIDVRNVDIATWDATSGKPVPTGWFKQADNQAGTTVVGQVVAGADGADNDGSLHLATPKADDKVQLQRVPKVATKLSDFTVGSYLAKVNALGSPAAYQLVADCNGGTLSDGGYTTLNFNDPGQKPEDGWVKHDVVQGDKAQWWSSRTINENGTTTSAGNAPTGAGIQGGPGSVKTLADFKAICPNGTVLTYAIDMGSGSAGLDGNVDAITFNDEVSDFRYETVDRFAGKDRVATAIEASRAEFDKAGTADAAHSVVLASSAGFADGLAGGPLAAAYDGPLLLNGRSSLDKRVAAEITRILPPKDSHGDRNPVFLIGSTASLDTPVEQAVAKLGYVPVRLAGHDRFETAVAVAEAMDDPQQPLDTVLLTSGMDFPDALSAGPAASHENGAVLLTNGSRMPRATADFLSRHVGATIWTVGRDASKAAPSTPASRKVYGADRYETSVKVAQKFFNHPETLQFASGEAFPDALGAGAFSALADSPLLLVRQATLPASVRDYVKAEVPSVGHAAVFGGPSSIGEAPRLVLEGILNSAS